MRSLSEFFHLLDLFCTARGIQEATASTLIFDRGARVEELKSGRDIGIRRLYRAKQYLSEHWPENAVWPDGIERPEPVQPELFNG